ncbi:FecR family protein [Rhizobium gallicum]|uniref:FecR family protein n=1 Tax=Rhizobium gallicum TaxID=56730 RepID=A0A1L5NMV5_9HYPH|nr:FecR domain-containing protein [Rhizobium gallicum]APO69226.1 FecR family protein [Rhizobium gallicum]
MSYVRLAAATVFSAVLSSSMPASAAEQVGQAVRIKTEVTGQTGPLTVNAAVHRDERIRTSKSGLGQFLFRDGTKLAVGWGSSVVIDKYIFDDSQSVKKLSIRAAKGTFRWISGSSKSSAYQILTPAGTIGVRGTAFDFYVGPDGTTAVVMLNGAAQFCGPGGCRQLTRRCDCVVATPNGNMTDVARVNQGVLRRLGTPRALPFLSGSQSLSGMMGGGCGLTAALQRPDNLQRQAPAVSPPEPKPEKPNKPDKPDKPDRPHKPDKPDRPHKPDKPDKPDGPHKPDKPHDHDRPHKSHDHHRGDHDRDRDKGDHHHGKDRDRDRGERNHHR